MATSVIKDTVSIDHAKSGTWRSGRSGCLHLSMVTTKLIDDNLDDIPSIFNPNIIISAAGPGALITEYGAYETHEVSENPSQSSAPPIGFIQHATEASFEYATPLHLTIIATRYFPMQA